MVEREVKCLRINPILWKKVKIYCVKKDIFVSKYIEGLIKKDLKRKWTKWKSRKNL